MPNCKKDDLACVVRLNTPWGIDIPAELLGATVTVTEMETTDYWFPGATTWRLKTPAKFVTLGFLNALAVNGQRIVIGPGLSAAVTTLPDCVLQPIRGGVTVPLAVDTTNLNAQISRALAALHDNVRRLRNSPFLKQKGDSLADDNSRVKSQDHSAHLGPDVCAPPYTGTRDTGYHERMVREQLIAWDRAFKNSDNTDEQLHARLQRANRDVNGGPY